jgi:hypothetical protein
VTTFFARPSTNICITFGFCIGRACTLTVLYNLNTRKDPGVDSNVVSLSANSFALGTAATPGPRSASNPLRACPWRLCVCLTLIQRIGIDVETAITRDDGTYYGDSGGKDSRQDSV